MGITPPDQRSRPADSPQTSVSSARMAGAVACVALAIFAGSVTDDSFVDEYAYITQSYYADLFFSGALNHTQWLDLYARDLQPLPKYMIGLCLRAAHLKMPGPVDALRWYRDTHTTFGTPA